MKTKTFLTLLSIIPISIGGFCVFAPAEFIELVKHAPTDPVAEVMARTTGVLLMAIGMFNGIVRNEPPLVTRWVVLLNLIVQGVLLPVDVLAFFSGTYTRLSAFVPNTVLHVVVVSGCLHQFQMLRREASSSSSTRS